MSPQVEKITVMLGKLVDGKSQYVQKLMWTLNDLLNIANGSSVIKNESSFEFSFGKKIKFHQLYEYIKSNREGLCIQQTFHSRPAFAKHAKMSVSLQTL